MSHYQFNYLILLLIKKSVLKPGKHGRGTGGAAPASDAVGRGDAQGTPLLARPAASGRVGPRGSHVVFTDARRREPIRLRRAPTRADSGRLGPESAISAGISRYRPKRPKFKKKKKPRMHRFHRNSKHTPHITSHSLCLCASVLSASLPLCFVSLSASLLLLNLVYVCIM